MGMMSKELRGEWEFVPNVVASGSVAKCVVEVSGPLSPFFFTPSYRDATRTSLTSSCNI